MNQPAAEQSENGENQEAPKEEVLSSDDGDLQFGDGKPDYEAIIAELEDQLVRARAETENVRKRGQRDLEDNNKYAITGFARDLVSVLENLQRAMGAISPEMRDGNAEVKNLAMGVEMILKELLTVFSKYGITRVEPTAGDKFDHNVHQAMSQIETTELEPGSIMQVMQAGYTIYDRLLQPAMVGVAKGPEADDSGEAVNTEA